MTKSKARWIYDRKHKQNLGSDTSVSRSQYFHLQQDQMCNRKAFQSELCMESSTYRMEDGQNNIYSKS